MGFISTECKYPFKKAMLTWMNINTTEYFIVENNVFASSTTEGETIKLNTCMVLLYNITIGRISLDFQVILQPLDQWEILKYYEILRYIFKSGFVLSEIYN